MTQGASRPMQRQLLTSWRRVRWVRTGFSRRRRTWPRDAYTGHGAARLLCSATGGARLLRVRVGSFRQRAYFRVARIRQSGRALSLVQSDIHERLDWVLSCCRSRREQQLDDLFCNRRSRRGGAPYWRHRDPGIPAPSTVSSYGWHHVRDGRSLEIRTHLGRAGGIPSVLSACKKKDRS